MPNINRAYQWAIDTCNAPNVGYSQDYRNAQVVDGVTYYDCSSFIWHALQAAGFDVVGAFEECQGAWDGDPIRTYQMHDWLLALGFVKVPLTGEWKKGDIGLINGHTEMVYTGGTGQGVCMGAHTGNVELEWQVSIGSSSGNAEYISPTDRWTSLWRYGNGVTGDIVRYEWIHGSNEEYFEDFGPEQKNNACCIYQFFYARGWSLEAVAALCGNVHQECRFNPCLIEHGGTGHGIVQWTPPDDLYEVLDVLYGDHDDWWNGDKQCNVIYAEYEEKCGLADRGIEPQWYATDEYPMSWEEWSHSTGDPGEMAMAFCANYERPAVIRPNRAEYALQWYEYLKTVDPTGGWAAHKPKGLSKLLLWAIATDEL